MGKGGAYMVSTVLQCSREQCSRKKPFRLKGKSFRPKCLFLSALLLHCNTVFCAQAHDFGIRGKIAPITEEDPIVIIQNKLKNMEERGELELHNLELQKKTKAAIERPKPVTGIYKAAETRIFYYDPTYVVKEDLKDHQGQIIHAKGTRINPLETVNLSQNLLFFDGDDEQQVAFAKEKLKKAHLKLILTHGAPLALSEELKVPVYFDQSGLLTKKLGIHHIPALVTQIGLRLRIDETRLKGEINEK